MNQRNVEALSEMLRPFMRYDTKPSVEIIARVLAGQGVLVPSALTDDEASGAVYASAEASAGYNGEHLAVIAEPDQLRKALEKIAKGEQ